MFPQTKSFSTRRDGSCLTSECICACESLSANYRSGDPWNQTPADNPNWLEQFKKDVGLLDEASPSQVLD